MAPNIHHTLQWKRSSGSTLVSGVCVCVCVSPYCCFAWVGENGNGSAKSERDRESVKPAAAVVGGSVNDDVVK